MKDSGKQLTDEAKRLFDDSVERLDGATLSRLNQARHKALEELDSAQGAHAGRWRYSLWGARAAGVAVVAVVAVIVMRGPQGVDDADFTASDFEMLIESESLEMYDDLEFFSLLEELDLDAGGNVG